MTDIVITLAANLTVSDTGDLFENEQLGSLSAAQAEVATRLSRYRNTFKRLSGRRNISGGSMDSVSVVNQHSGGTVLSARWRKLDG